MSKKKDIKEKNELDELLQTIKKSLNNKTSLTKDDMSTALQVIEINKVKKELLDTTEKMTALRYVEKEKDELWNRKFSKQAKERLKNIKTVKIEKLDF